MANVAYFSNENVAAPLQMDSAGLWLTVAAQPNVAADQCIAVPVTNGNAIVSTTTTSFGSQPTTLYALGAPGGYAVPAYIGMAASINGLCYQLVFIALTTDTRDRSMPMASQIVASATPL